MRYFCFFVLAFFYNGTVTANALVDFSNSMYSFSADFTQTVYDSDSSVLQENQGQVKLVRPGKFRWTYNEPFKQVIVADGLTLWVYDEDIAQVTMRPQADTLGSAPIGLLSGQRALEREFDIVELGSRDGLEWFQLEPLVKDTDFQQVYIAIDNNGLRAMELRDSFEQATQIRFANFKKNIAIAAEEFVFVPPAGADVVGEVGVASEEDVTVSEPVVTPQTEVAAPAVEPAPLSDADLLAEPELPIAQTEAIVDEVQPAGSDENAVVPTQESTPVTAEDVLQVPTAEQLVEVPDDAPGAADTEGSESPAEGEVTFEVIEKVQVPTE